MLYTIQVTDNIINLEMLLITLLTTKHYQPPLTYALFTFANEEDVHNSSSQFKDPKVDLNISFPITRHS